MFISQALQDGGSLSCVPQNLGDVVDVISLDVGWEVCMVYLTTWYDIHFLWRKEN